MGQLVETKAFSFISSQNNYSLAGLDKLPEDDPDYVSQRDSMVEQKQQLIRDS